MFYSVRSFVMNIWGGDYHKPYGHVTVVDDKGLVLCSARVNNEPAEFEELLSGLNGRNHAVVGASRTWGVMYDSRDFSCIYSEATAETERRRLTIIIEEIRCVVKKSERKGDIVPKLRGDGSIKKEWEEAKKKEEPSCPQFGGLTPRVAWLSETHDKSNYILLRIPIEIGNSAHGEKAIAAAEGPLRSSLPLSQAAITRLQDSRLIRLPQTKPVK